MKPFVWITVGFVWLAAMMPAPKDVCAAELLKQETSAGPAFATPAKKETRPAARERRRAQQVRQPQDELILFTVR